MVPKGGAIGRTVVQFRALGLGEEGVKFCLALSRWKKTLICQVSTRVHHVVLGCLNPGPGVRSRVWTDHPVVSLA